MPLKTIFNFFTVFDVMKWSLSACFYTTVILLKAVTFNLMTIKYNWGRVGWPFHLGTERNSSPHTKYNHWNFVNLSLGLSGDILK